MREADRLARRIAAGDRSPATGAQYAAAVGATLSGMIYLARMQSESRRWTGMGWTEAEAKAALLERWLDHVGPRDGDEDDVPRTLEDLDGYYGIAVDRRTVGRGYVDDECDDDRRSHLRPRPWR